MQPQAGCSGKGHPEGRAMWLPSALLLLCVPGSLSLSGPGAVTGPVGGSLSVQCRYRKEYEAFVKYWCRQPCLPVVSEMVETSDSKGEVRRGRMSIVDQPGNLTFTVTLRNLTANDAGKYRCGISTLLVDDGISGFLPEPFFQVQVFVSPGERYLGGESRGQGTGSWSSPSASTTASSRESSARTPGPPSRDPGSLLSSAPFLLLIFLKIPLLLGMLSAVLWVNRPQRAYL